MKGGMNLEKCHDHLSLIQAMAEAYPPHEIGEMSIEAYMLALHDVPLKHCARAAAELIRKHEGDFMPSFGRWRSIAADFWNEEICRQESSEKLLEIQPPEKHDREKVRRELHQEILQRATGDGPDAKFWEELAHRMANFGKKPYKPWKSGTEMLEERNAELDQEHAEKLANMTPEQLEARRLSVLRTHGPEKGGASVSSAIFICDGCGKSLKPGTESYRGPAPGKVGDAALCGVCHPRYPWAGKPKRRKAKA